jgi:hypothetical protein
MYVTPDNYRSLSRPWAAGLDRYLKEVWHYREGGEIRARLFEITVDDRGQTEKGRSQVKAARDPSG